VYLGMCANLSVLLSSHVFLSVCMSGVLTLHLPFIWTLEYLCLLLAQIHTCFCFMNNHMNDELCYESLNVNIL
jgi:hypothetical protein